MGLESATWIDDLVTTNPATTDLKQQGDDHLRMIKEVLKNTFPNANKAWRFPDADGDAGDQTFGIGAQNGFWGIDTSGGACTATLPSLSGADAGWSASFFKSTYDANPFFIQPASGTIRTGYIEVPKARRAIPFLRTLVWWDGSVWYADRVVSTPIATIIPYAGNGLPPGYVYANGQTLSTSDYPEYAQVRGSGTTPDLRGRVIAGKDDMGGVSANRLTGLSGGINGDNFEEAGGSESVVLTLAQLAAHTHGGTTGGQSADHTHIEQSATGAGASTKPPSQLATGVLSSGNTPTLGTSNDHTHTFTTDSQGSGSGHNNIQPTIIEDYVIVVE